MLSKLTRVVACVALLLSAGSCMAACSTAPVYNLTMELRAPVWSSRDGYISEKGATEFGGNLTLKNLFPGSRTLNPLALTVGGYHALGGWNSIFDAKNELQVGVEYSLDKDFTFFSYWQRKFTKDVDRVFVGLRYKTSGTL